MQPDDRHARAVEVRLLAGIINRMATRDMTGWLGREGLDLGALQFGVMRFLSYRSATISEIADNMLLAPATLVRVVDALESKGFVRRGFDAQDRRRTPLYLTEAATELLQRMPATTERDLVGTSLTTMGNEKSAQLLALMRDLVTNMAGGEEVISRVHSVASPDRDADPQRASEDGCNSKL